MNMRSGFMQPFAAVLAVGLPAALAALVPGWGPVLGPVVAVVGAALVARAFARHHAEPMADLARSVLSSDEEAPTADLVRRVSTQHREAVAALSDVEARQQRRETALAHAADGVILLGPDGLVEYANPAARLLLHERVLDVTQRLLQPDLDRLVREASEQGHSVTEEVALRIPSPRPALARVIPVPSGGSVLLLSDLSESYRLDRVRQDFVANVSHELKTPVAGIRALADVAASAAADGDEETARTFIARLGHEAERLGRLVGDLLDLSRVESGTEPEREPVELRGVLEGAAERIREDAEAKGIAVEVSCERIKVEADPSQLAMAVRNLADNAVRYSEGGTIRLSAERDNGRVAITVSDQGIGIPSDEIKRIFERFYRVDKARSRATGGTGLGLAIVRHVVENHGGRVDVSSELGLGSTFTVTLPVSAPDRKGHAA